VRNYTAEPVDREAVERIVARGRKAPSGGFSQGVRMVVVTDEETRRRIAELANEEYYIERGGEPWSAYAQCRRRKHAQHPPFRGDGPLYGARRSFATNAACVIGISRAKNTSTASA